MLKLELKKKEGLESKYEEAKNKIKIWEDKYDALVKNFQDAITSFEIKSNEINQQNLFLKQQQYIFCFFL